MTELVEVLASLVFLAGFVGLFIWGARKIKARRLAALAARMAPYREYHERALAAEDPAMIVDAALKLAKAERLWLPFSSASTAAMLYRRSLPLLRGRPDLRPQVLELGRCAYGWPRSEGSPTVYDEQAIQNDMIAYG